MKLVPDRSISILDFDCEARPLAWYGGDWVTKEVTAIACIEVGKPRRYMKVWALGEVSMDDMLDGFLAEYDQADIVTGHYLHGFDLPLLNAQLARVGRRPLSPKLVQDTKNDLVKLHGVSKSQENLSAMLGTMAEKQGMTTTDWEQGNRLSPEGIVKTKQRVTRDVIQHLQLRSLLMEQGLLGPPRLWRP